MTFTNLEKYVYSKKSAPRKLLDLLNQKRTGGLLRSFNSAWTDWNSLPEDMRCLPYNAFKISLLKHFKSQ